MTDIRQSLQYADFLRQEGWIVERINSTSYFIRKFPLIGSVLKLQRPETINYQYIDVLVTKYRVFQVIIEPKNETQAKLLASNCYKLSNSPYLPSKTLQLDLSLSMNRLTGSMKKDTRRAIKRGDTKNIKEYSSPSELKNWREAWKKSVKFDHYVPGAQQLLNLRKSFPDNYSVFFASHNISSRIIGGALFTRSLHDVAYYWYGFTNKEGRTSLSQYSILYQGILWAKKMGCKVFDFEGIYDPRFPNKSWLGFSHFKESFGGLEIEYPGAFVKNRLPF